MRYKYFSYHNGNFSLNLPLDWDEYDDGSNNTYAFFNSISWTGNFRVTPLYFTDNSESGVDNVAKYITEKIGNNKAERLQLGELDCAYSKEISFRDGETQTIYYWIVGKMNTLLTCSFAIDQGLENTDIGIKQVQIVQDIVRSIKIA